jgi:DNA-binding transcriptional LysR family regulator
VPRNVRRIAIVSLPLGVLALPDSHFAEKKELKLFDLAGQRVILSDSSLTLGTWIEEAFSRSFIDLTQRARTNSIGLMVDLAKRNLGTVLQTRVGIEQEIADGALKFVPLRDAKLNPRKLMLLSRSEKEMSDAASALGKLLAKSIERSGEDGI